jgi:prophage antirepressor-like protein
MSFDLTSVFKTPGGADIRTHDAADGTRWIVATDVCKVLGIKNTSQAVSRLEATSKGICLIDTLRGKQPLLAVNEAGFWRLVMRSDKPFAAAFGNWLATHVIPAIGKHGGYLAGAEVLSNEAQTKLYAEMREKAAEALRLHDHKTQHDHWIKSPGRRGASSTIAAQAVAQETGLPFAVVIAAAGGGVKSAMKVISNQQGRA